MVPWVDETWKWEELTISSFEAFSRFSEIIGYESFAKYQKRICPQNDFFVV